MNEATADSVARDATARERRLDAMAALLRQAYSAGAVEPIRGCLADLDEAYAVQTRNTRAWVDAGRVRVGRKIGLTAVAVQRQLGVDQPDFGVLFEDMRVDDGGDVDPTRLLQPRIEAEIAFVLGADLTMSDPTIDDVKAATPYLLPALEIVDSRIRAWDIGILDTVADNASSGLFVLGTERCAWPTDGLPGCTMRMTVDGTVRSEGTGAACLGDPALAVAWLARTLRDRGDPLRAGDVVLSGALGPMVSLASGMHVEAEVGGLGSVSVRVRGGTAR